MMNMRYIRGFAFSVLLLSVVLIGMAGTNDISISVTSPSNGSTINGTTFVFTAQVSDTVENIVSVDFSYKNASSSWTSFYTNNTTLPNGTTHTLNALPFDTTTLANGYYQLNVTVIDNSTTNNTKSDTSTFFTVLNVLSDTTAPASVTNPSVAGNGTTWLLINWTNPNDSDFHHVMIYKNNSWIYNTTSNTTSSYNITGLTSGSAYEITVKTVDTTGNINQTGTNLTASTDQNTPASGSPVTITLQNSTVTFTSVTTPGNTIEAPNASKTLPSGYSAVGNYIDISTTALVTAPITVSVKYNPTSLPSGYSESDIRLYHWNDSTNQWDNVTISVYPDNDTVVGQVTSLSPFVPGVPPKPSITRVAPNATSTETIGVSTATFKIKVSQIANVTWKIDSLVVNTTTSVPNVDLSYSNNSAPTGNHTVNVTASNANGTDSIQWTWTVRPKSYETGNRIWDSSKEMNLTYTWNPMSFYAFYYDVDNNVGNESLKIILGSNSDRNIEENTLVYSTAPDNVSFKYKLWGYYNVIGFMAEKYFAAYTAGSKGITSTPVSPIGSKQLHKILMDDDTKRAVYAGSTLTLNEGYVLKVKDVDITGGKIVLLQLLKDGAEVDTTAVSAGSTYVYSKKVGSVSEFPIIAVHIDTVFSGREANAAFLKGIFQVSESFTSINTGNRYGIMEITGASDTAITMVNKNSLSLSPNSINDVMGDIKIIVADNSSVLRFAPMVTKSGTYEMRGTVSPSTDNKYDWNPLNFEGFYYDINEDVGSEKLSLTRTDRSVAEKNLVYTTTPQEVSFKYKKFGSFKVIGFMAEKYFAGYTSSSNVTGGTVFSTISNKQLHKVLVDDDTQRAVYAGSTLTLNEGYVLKVKDVDITGGKIVLLQLLKDGGEVDTTAIEATKTYVYSKRVGTVSDMPIIAAHIETVFSGREANAAFIKGVFQLSESFTSVKTGDRFGAMEVTEVSDNKIEMNNPSTVSLSQAGTVDIMGKIKFRVADSGDVRFYPFIMVNGSAASANQLSINVPATLTVKDIITITVTAGGTPISGAAVGFDNNDIGTTNSTGQLDYTLTRSGMHNITATKLGYEKATKTIQVAEWVDNRLSIEVPAIIDQGIPVSIKVISNGTAIAGASVTFDNSAIGTTDASGILNYTFNVGGTHNLGASKDKYVSVSREINIRLPFSEYKALDLSIVPRSVFTNDKFLIISNITNAGTKADTRAVELILNGSVVDNRSVSLAPGEIKEINFTRKEALPGNYTVEILGQKGLLEVKEEPLSFLLIGGIVTGLGAIIIYFLTAKNKINLELLRQKLMGKFVAKEGGEIKK